VIRAYLEAAAASGRADDAAARVGPLLAGNGLVRGAWMEAAARHVPPEEAARWLARVAPHVDASRAAEPLALAQAWLVLARRAEIPAHDTAALDALRAAGRAVQADAAATAAEWEALGAICDAARAYDEAERAYRAALAIDPMLPVASNNLAMLVLNRGGDAAEAQVLATQAASHREHPRLASFLETLATVHAKRGAHADALRTLGDAIRLDGRNLLWQVKLAQLLVQTGQADKARSTLWDIERGAALRVDLPAATREQIDALRTALKRVKSD
jgi:Tfp pilus assembly protein PilF